MQHHNPNLDFGELETQEKGMPVPPSVTLLVSLFLILLTFFIVINRSTGYSDQKKDTIIKSINNKFGMPTDESINFGTIVPPRVEDFVVELEQLFATNANIQSTINGEETTISATKDYFFFADEKAVRNDRLETVLKLQDILTRWTKSSKLKITITMSLDDYALDREKLDSFRRVLAMPGMDIGLDTGSKNKFMMNIKYD